MSWMLLLLAGLCEVGWAVGFKILHSSPKPLSFVLTLVALVASMVLLAFAMKNIPIGTAYAVWTGIGAIGVFLFGTFFLDEPLNTARVVSIILVVAGLVGLKIYS